MLVSVLLVMMLVGLGAFFNACHAAQVIRTFGYGEGPGQVGRIATSSDEYDIAPTAIVAVGNSLYVIDRARHRLIPIGEGAPLSYDERFDFVDAVSTGAAVHLFDPRYERASTLVLDAGGVAHFEAEALTAERTAQVFYGRSGGVLDPGLAVSLAESDGACTFVGSLSALDELFLALGREFVARFVDCDCVGQCNPSEPEFQGELVLFDALDDTAPPRELPILGPSAINRAVPVGLSDDGLVAVRVDSAFERDQMLRSVSWVVVFDGDRPVAYTEPLAGFSDYRIEGMTMDLAGDVYALLVGDQNTAVWQLAFLPAGEKPWDEMDETTAELVLPERDPKKDLGLLQEVDSAKESVTRAEVLACIFDYASYSWTPTKELYGEATMCDPGAGAYSSRPAYLRKDQETQGVPYCWGCGDSIAEIDQVLKDKAKLAGNTCARRDCPECVQPDLTFGVDCSGLVSNCWRIGEKIGTWAIPEHGTPIAFQELSAGDVLNRPGRHVYVFVGLKQTSSGQKVSVVDASLTTGRVALRDVPLSELDGYTPLRLSKLLAR